MSCTLTDNCIILDIDNTLIESQFKGDLPEHFKNNDRCFAFTIDSETYYAVLRPMTHRFLTYIFKYFKLVCVWSLGKQQYVHKVVERIFENHTYPHAVLSYEDSTDIPGMNIRTKPICVMMQSNELCRQHMRLDNTIIVDDNKHNFYHNPRNGILMPQFTLKKVTRSYHNDISLFVLMIWLHNNRDKNLVSLSKSSIFKRI